MKFIILILTMMTITNAMAQNGKASTIKKTFSRQTSISIEIDASPVIIWSLLTNASDYPRWNSTIVSIHGDIAKGEKIRLKSTLDAKRTFKLKVKDYISEKSMIWGDGKGDRLFTIKENSNGGITFSMNEKIGGLMYPMYAKYIPPFDESFEHFARDLKKEAELIQNTKN